MGVDEVQFEFGTMIVQLISLSIPILIICLIVFFVRKMNRIEQQLTQINASLDQATKTMNDANSNDSKNTE